MQFDLPFISKRQPISSTSNHPLLLTGVPEVHACAHLLGTNRHFSSYIDMCNPQPVMATSAAGSTMQFRKAYPHPTALIQDRWISEDFGLCCIRDGTGPWLAFSPLNTLL